jgi:hypothetical protein
MTTPIGSPANNVPIYVKRGSDWTATFTLYNSDDEVVDLTDSSFRGEIRKKRLSPNMLAEFAFDINLSTNEVTVSLDKEDIRVMEVGETDDDKRSKYVYDWEWTRADGSIDRFQEGTLTISSEVTRNNV